MVEFISRLAMASALLRVDRGCISEAASCCSTALKCYIVVIYEEPDDETVIPVTAYEVAEP
jgi:hypothetical protein